MTQGSARVDTTIGPATSARDRGDLDGASGRPSTTMLLIRTTVLDDRVLEFADVLAGASGHDLAFVLDERKRPGPPCKRPIVGLTPSRCEALGLFCPPDFAWKCGDYGYYLARETFASPTHFWMIEYDVRFVGRELAGFFASFAARPEVDLVTAFLEPAGWDWHWAVTARARDVRPTRCLFPVTRLSARAIDALRDKRIAQGRRALRRFLWPNDEALVATTLCHGAFTCRDLNDFGRIWYDATTFSFSEPIDGDTLERDAEDLRIFHPVLHGEQYERKVARLAEAHAPRSSLRGSLVRVAAKLNSFTAW